MDREIICICCPLGCRMTVSGGESGNEKVTVTGNSCKRGETYAREEIVSPKRIVTTSIRLSSGKMAPVKTEHPIDKKNIFTLLRLLSEVKEISSTRIGQVVFTFEGVNIIATKDVD